MSELSPVVLRVATPDRTTTARDLLTHHRAGRLSRPELDVRLALAAAARTEEDLRMLTLDLPDAPAVPEPQRPTLPRAEGTDESLGVATDIMVMLVTMAAFVCTALLFAVTSGWLRGDAQVALALASFGSFSVGAGSLHLAHRVLRRRYRG